MEFIKARLDEDEQAAREVSAPLFPRDPFSRRFSTWESDHSEADSEFVDRFDPDRILAEVKAKRRVITMYEDAHRRAENAPNADAAASARVARSTLQGVLTVMAQVYKDHPEFKGMWEL